MKELQKLLMQAETFITKNIYELDSSEKNLLEKIIGELQAINKESKLTFNERIECETWCWKLEFLYVNAFIENKQKELRNDILIMTGDSFTSLERVIDDDTKFKNYFRKMIKYAARNVSKEWACSAYKPYVILYMNSMIRRMGRFKKYFWDYPFFIDFYQERQQNLRLAKKIVSDKFNALNKEELLE